MASGCSRSPYELAQVHGTVTLDGKPLSSAKVMFAPVEIAGNVNPGKPAFGLIQNDGSFVLTTYEMNDGAIVGEHWVSIIALREKPREATLVSHSPAAAPKFDRLSLPQKAMVVAESDNQIDFNLTSQDVARYGVVLHD
jgi:hypothetical protein